MNKTRNNELIKLADEALKAQEVFMDQVVQKKKDANGISKILNNGSIDESYNSSIAALGVSIAMSGLLPTLAMYYQEKSDSATQTKANRRSVLDVIARMITNDSKKLNSNWDFSRDNRFAENLFRYAVNGEDSSLKQEVADCAIALKQIVRTYNLVKTEKQ